MITGAYAVISEKLELNSVYAENSAKRILSTEEYIQRREAKQLKEAVNIYRLYYQRFGKVPDKSIFYEYLYLFTSNKELPKLYKSKMKKMEIMKNVCFTKKIYAPI